MKTFGPTQQEIDALTRLINGEDYSVLDTDTPERLLAFTASVSRAMARYCTRCRSRNKNLSDKIDSLRKKRTDAYEKGEFINLEFDSLDIARAILFCLKSQGMHYTKSRINLLLYQCYCSWLYNKGEIITIETPVAQPSGPWFWRVMQNLDVHGEAPVNWLETISSTNPGLARFIENACRKYGHYSEEDLQKAFRNSTPYKNAHKDKNGGKWNKAISPADIYAYQKTLRK